GTTRLRIEEGKFPGPEASVDASPGDDRRRRAARVEADATRIEKLHPARRPQIELATRFQEELALFGEEERKAGEVDDLLVGLYLREVGIDRDVGRQRRRDPELGVDAALAADVTILGRSADAIVLRL